jgi:hypothetical protein
MKNINILSAIAIMLIGITMAINAMGQTLNHIAKFNAAFTAVDTQTPIFEDATNLRIGIGTTSPSFKLDVSSGDINLHTITNGYRIGGSASSTSNYVLWHNGDISSIFVGVGAGNNFMNHHAHVCVGQLSGTRITIGDSLTFVGDESGTTNDTGSYNTAVGCRALFSNRSADGKTVDSKKMVCQK